MSGDRDTWAVVPFKGFDRAKQRLAARFAPAERRELAMAMFDDVLDILASVPGLAGIVIVTPDETAAARARARGLEAILEPAEQGLCPAIAAAGAYVTARGCDVMLVVPCDVPAATAEEFSHLLSVHRAGRAFTVVPSHDGIGTNAIVVSPPDAVPPAFGGDSFAVHLTASRAAGLGPTIISPTGLSLDIDTPEDCCRFRSLGRAGRTFEFLSRHALYQCAS